jgi:hypothetical protein
MATTLDLDEILGGLLEVKWGDTVVYSLRTDVGSRILLAAFSIRSIAQRLANVPDDASLEQQVTAAEAVVDAYNNDVHKVCLRIVQHTYPTETSEELYRKLSEVAQEQVVKAFFTRRWLVSNQQPSDTNETSSGMASTTTGTTTANRANRRAAAKRLK